MARIRYLKPDFFKDEDLSLLPFETRLFYQGLWCQADKAGRLQDRPARLKVEIFPYDDVDIEKCLNELATHKKSSGKPFINRYISDGQGYIEIVTWCEHQKPHHTEKVSEIPPAPPYGKGNGKGNGKAAQPECDVKEPLYNRYPTVKSYTIEEVKDACALLGIPEQHGQSYYDHYSSQGWQKANKLVITELRGHMVKRWNKDKQCWDFDERTESKKRSLPVIIGKICSKEGCGLPAVYKSTGGSYDYYYCNEHMPAKVKEQYR